MAFKGPAWLRKMTTSSHAQVSEQFFVGHISWFSPLAQWTVSGDISLYVFVFRGTSHFSFVLNKKEKRHFQHRIDTFVVVYETKIIRGIFIRERKYEHISYITHLTWSRAVILHDSSFETLWILLCMVYIMGPRYNPKYYCLISEHLYLNLNEHAWYSTFCVLTRIVTF